MLAAIVLGPCAQIEASLGSEGLICHVVLDSQ